MGNEVPKPPPLIEWGVAAQPLEGEAESGDLHVVQRFPKGVLVAAVDGLGHGPEAAAAARSAVATLKIMRTNPSSRCLDAVTKG